MHDRKSSREEVELSFRKALEDVLPIVQSLAPLCQTLEELTSMVELATINNGQLRLLMDRVLAKSK